MRVVCTAAGGALFFTRHTRSSGSRNVCVCVFGASSFVVLVLFNIKVPIGTYTFATLSTAAVLLLHIQLLTTLYITYVRLSLMDEDQIAQIVNEH